MSNRVSDLAETGSVDEKNSVPGSKVPLFFIFLCIVCMASLYSNILTFHMTTNMVHSYGNGSEDDYYNISDYRDEDEGRVNITIQVRRFLSNSQKESFITVVPIGGFIAYFPISFMYNAMGFRRTFVACSVLCIIPSMLVPLCINAKTYVLAIIVRIFQGFALASFVPFVCKLSVFLPFGHIAIPSVVFSYMQIASLFSFPVCALLSWSSLGWHSAHYVTAISTFTLFLLFIIINFDDEFKEKASQYGIMDAFCNYERVRSRLLTLRLPYLSIYQDVHIWATFFAAFGYFTAMQLYLQWAPTFLHKVVGLSIVPVGLLSMIPPASNLIIGFVAYGIFPRLANTVENKMRVFNSLGTVVPGVLFMLIGLFDANTQPGSVTALFVVACSLLSFCSCGFFRMAQLRSAHLHLFILIHTFAINMIASFLTSLFNVLIAKDNQYDSWASVFILHGAILIVTNIVFCVLVSGETAPWAKEGYEDTSIQPRREDPLPQRPL